MFSLTENPNIAENVNSIFLVILGISVVLLLLITGLMITFVIKYNAKKNVKPQNIKGNTVLEIVWTIVPVFIVLGMFYFGWIVYRSMHDIPQNAMEIKVTGRMWSWLFKYKNGVQTDTLYVPVGKPIKLAIGSEDVNHSLYIPAFRVKQDAVPGMTTSMWFQPDAIGDFDVLCAEYCGDRHSYMLTKVVVMSEEAYNIWYEREGKAVQELAAADSAGAESFVKKGTRGKRILQVKGCVACHSFDGSKLVGPTFLGAFGKVVTVVSNGIEKDIRVDEDYLRRSILDPKAEIVKGFDPLMPKQEGLLTKNELEEIIAYLKDFR